MRKIFGISLKSTEFEFPHNSINDIFQNKEFEDFCTKRLKLFLYGQNCDNSYYENENLLLAYTGTIYFQQNPELGINIEKSKFFNLLNDIDSGFQSVKGKYNIIYYDKNLNKLRIKGDRFAMFPLFIYENEKYFIFCNDYEYLIPFIKGNSIYSVDALYEYFLFGSPQNNKSIFKDIRLLAPGEQILIHNDILEIKRDPSISIHMNRNNIDQIAEEYFFALKDEVNQSLVWNPEIMISLTGGADTRMILGCISEELRHKHSFFTLRSHFVNDEENQDLIIAKLLAKEFNLNHSVLSMPDFYDIEELNNKFFECVRENLPVFISGFLGTESLRFLDSYNSIPYLNRKLITKTFIHPVCNDFFIDLPHEANFETVFMKAKTYIDSFFNNPSTKDVDYFKEEVFNSIKHIDCPHPEIAYTINYLTRSFFSNHWGGAISPSSLTTASSVRHYQSPFFSENILKILFSINIKSLDSSINSISNTIFKNHLNNFCKTPSNSGIAKDKTTALKIFNRGIHADSRKQIVYSEIEMLINNETIINTGQFNLNQLKHKFHFSPNQKAKVWWDLLYWIKYSGGY